MTSIQSNVVNLVRVTALLYMHRVAMPHAEEYPEISKYISVVTTSDQFNSNSILFLSPYADSYSIKIPMQPPDCILRMILWQSPSPGHPSAADEAWYWQKRILSSG